MLDRNDNMKQLLGIVETHTWKNYSNVLEYMLQILDDNKPTDEKLHTVYGIYVNIIKSILSHDVNFNKASFSHCSNIDKRIDVLMAAMEKRYSTLALVVTLYFYRREVWGTDNINDHKSLIIDQQIIENIKSRIVEKQYVCGWKTELEVVNEINLIISSGYIDKRVLGEFLTYNEFQLFQTIAPCMGNNYEFCDVKYDPMVSNYGDIINIGRLDKIVRLDDIKVALNNCERYIKRDNLRGCIPADQLLMSDYMSAMVDVKQLIDVVGRDLILTISSLVMRLGESHNTNTIDQIVGQIDSILKESNKLDNRLIMVIPASVLLIHSASVKEELWENHRFHKMLDYCKELVDKLTPNVMTVSDLTYCIRTLVNQLGGINSVDYSKFQTRFGKELIYECFGLTENVHCESRHIPDTSITVLSELTEGFNIRRGGEIVIPIKDKDVSFVEEYARVHRFIKLNYKDGNYDSLRANIVYLIILVENIEKSVIYNHKVPVDSELRADAQRAIRLANSDISIYTDKLRQAGVDVKINDLYREAKANNEMIVIDTVSTISGIKAIVKTILI